MIAGDGSGYELLSNEAFNKFDQMAKQQQQAADQLSPFSVKVLAPETSTWPPAPASDEKEGSRPSTATAATRDSNTTTTRRYLLTLVAPSPYVRTPIIPNVLKASALALASAAPLPAPSPVYSPPQRAQGLRTSFVVYRSALFVIVFVFCCSFLIVLCVVCSHLVQEAAVSAEDVAAVRTHLEKFRDWKEAQVHAH